MTKQQQKTPLTLERVTYEEAQELARRRKWTVGFTLSIIWSNFKSVGDLENAQVAYVLMQREEEHKGKKDPIFTE
jgi:predicted DNA-binding ribbon-helix-helix protein